MMDLANCFQELREADHSLAVVLGHIHLDQEVVGRLLAHSLLAGLPLEVDHHNHQDFGHNLSPDQQEDHNRADPS